MERIFHENLAQLNQRGGQVMNGLLGIGLEVTLLTNEALIELFYNFYNPQTVERKEMVLPGEQGKKNKNNMPKTKHRTNSRM